MLGFFVQVSMLRLLQCRFIRKGRGSCHARFLCAGQYVTSASVPFHKKRYLPC
jgi:hypothetical protein